MSSRVTERGEITIDAEAREQLGVRPGMVAYQRVVDGHLEVFFLPGPHKESLYGVFHMDGEPPLVVTPGQLEEAVMEAIAAEQVESGNDA